MQGLLTSICMPSCLCVTFPVSDYSGLLQLMNRLSLFLPAVPAKDIVTALVERYVGVLP